MSTQQSHKVPRSVGEAFPSKWLSSDDVKRPVVVRIDAIEYPEVYVGGQKENRIAIAFAFVMSSGEIRKLEKRLIVNKTQAHAIADVVGSQVFADWIGHDIQLSAGVAANRKPTIVVTAPPSSPSSSMSSDATVTSTDEIDNFIEAES